MRFSRRGIKLHSEVQLLTEHILVEVGNAGRAEGWLPQGALLTPRESCANDVNFDSTEQCDVSKGTTDAHGICRNVEQGGGVASVLMPPVLL